MAASEEILEYIKSNDIKWLDLQFVDVPGRLHSTSILASDLEEEELKRGIELSLESVFGFSEKGYVLVPDGSTFARIPWEGSSLRMLSDIYLNGKERFERDSRYCIERVMINGKAMGISEIEIGAEVEFYIFDSVSGDKVVGRGPNYLIESREAPWNPTPIRNHKINDYLSPPFDNYYPARVQIAEVMYDHFKYKVLEHRHGPSPTGHQMIKLDKYQAKTAGDAFTTLKYVVRNLAALSNSVATFMPYPVAGETGSEVRISFSLSKKGKNIMFENGELTDSGRYFIGGLLEHAEALSVFVYPTTNSYKKLRKHPRYIAYSPTNTNTVVQVRKNEVIFCADPSINPYIAYSAVLAAGLDGIKNKISPPDIVVEDIKQMSRHQMKSNKIKSMPKDLLSGIGSLESDNSFLKGYLSPDILAEYLDEKLKEHKENEARPTAYEIENYFNC